MLKNLKLLRAQKNISQQKLGSIIGVSQQSINKYENHTIEPDIKTLMLLADYFNTSIDYIVGYKNHEDFSSEITKREYEHIKNYRQLSEAEKKSIDAVINNYLHKN